MRKIYLPTLKKIRITNFSLYPNGLDFEHDFVNGVNLIIGGNGMGKTTFVNLIKYSIIGHYKKAFDYTRTYKGGKIEKRVLNPYNYFKNRLDESIKTESKATVTIEFLVNEDEYKVERSLEDIALNTYYKNGVLIEGKRISQNKYESYKEEEKEQFLLNKYEKDIEKSSNLPFDDLILFVNEILFFGEDHKTILWNDKGTDVQHELFHKYFNSPELDKARREAIREARYYDSLSRHRSEDIRAITDVLEKVADNKNKEKNDSDNKESLNFKILKLKKDLDKIDLKINKKQLERKEREAESLILNNKINELSAKVDNLEKSKKIAEKKLFESKYLKLHKNYDLYYQSIKTNHVCPLCTNEVEESYVDKVVKNPDNCILCDSEIKKIDNDDLRKDFNLINDELIYEHTKIQNHQKNEIEIDNELKKLDLEFRDIYKEKRKIQSNLRNLEFDLSQKPKSSSDELQAFYDEIEALEKLKEQYSKKSKIEKVKAKGFSIKIEKKVAKETSKFSQLFSEYAEEFLGVKCSLTFDDLGDGRKRLYPVINGKIRRYEEELSESQRFFIDHSFRMSILSFFYTKPSFYIVETPDSSLDISYEKNAAKVFTKFLELDNSLILTTNLNNSEFLNHLIDFSKDRISIVNLIEIAKKTFIQKSSESLNNIYIKIKQKMNNEQ